MMSRLDTARRMALDTLACAGLVLPAALLWPAYAPLIVLASYVVAVTVVLPFEPAEEYRRYGRLARLLGAIGAATALTLSLVVPEALGQAVEALSSPRITASVVRAIAAFCIGLVGLAIAYDRDRARGSGA